MHNRTRRIGWSVTAVSVALALYAAASAQRPLDYPQTRKVDHVDTYHGTKVPDPYRWLEDDNSPETAKWVQAQNAVTFGYLEQIPYRKALFDRLRAVNNYPKYSAPSRKGPYYFFSMNAGTQNQSVLHVQKGLEGAPEVLIDPNTWSEDATVRLAAFAPSKDATYAAYGVSRSGSDWQEYKVMELATKKPLADSLEWVKVSSPAWPGDGFYYSRYPAPAKGHERSSANENHQVFFHRVGTPQASDTLVFEDPANPQRFHTVETTDDERFAVLTISDRGSGKKGNALYVLDRSKGEKQFTPVIASIGDDSFNVIDNVGDQLLVLTDKNAPNGRIVLVDPKRPEEANWKVAVPERPEPLQGAGTGGRQALRHVPEGRRNGRVRPRPDRQAGARDPAAWRRERERFRRQTRTTPSSSTRSRLSARRRRSTDTTSPRGPARCSGRRQIKGFDAAAYETQAGVLHQQGRHAGADVPRAQEGAEAGRDQPDAALRLRRLQHHDVAHRSARCGSRCSSRGSSTRRRTCAAAASTARSGTRPGRSCSKQNVFDDFIAAAEWLIANKYTSPAKLAIQGGSNGGLLVGAVINQRPDLFRVAIPQVGVMDMLRFHKFTIGWNWIADYGSSDNAEEFKALYAYSPLHNIKAGAKYPATLITTADHDDRVVPAHSFKYAATLQEKASRENPVLIRIETKSGHGVEQPDQADRGGRGHLRVHLPQHEDRAEDVEA